MDYFRFLKPWLYRLSPETAHHFALYALQYRCVPKQPSLSFPSLETEVFGLKFPNPVGLAAGFDKDARAIPGLLQQGFGFVEVGTVTPEPQAGNPQPRMFRLEKDEAIINRMGFNNDGYLAFTENYTRNQPYAPFVTGINIGKNKTSEDAVEDYLFLLKHMYPFADYITVNISSPNTPGLRDLQTGTALDGLLSALDETRKTLRETTQRSVPLLVKIASDLPSSELEGVALLTLKHHMDGLIIGNTMVEGRDRLRSIKRNEQGGISGTPLFALSTKTLRTMYQLTSGRIPLIGVGGIGSARDAYTKIKAGASLVQLYTALIYNGFDLVTDIKKGLAECVKRDGFSHISEAVGIEARI